MGNWRERGAIGAVGNVGLPLPDGVVGLGNCVGGGFKVWSSVLVGLGDGLGNVGGSGLGIGLGAGVGVGVVFGGVGNDVCCW